LWPHKERELEESANAYAIHVIGALGVREARENESVGKGGEKDSDPRKKGWCVLLRWLRTKKKDGKIIPTCRPGGSAQAAVVSDNRGATRLSRSKTLVTRGRQLMRTEQRTKCNWRRG